MNVDAELDVWRQQWQSDAAVPLDLRTKVARQSRWMRIALIADILVTIVMGGGAIAYAAYAQQADTVLLAAVTWLFLACAWTFVLTMSRGTWSPSALDTAAFVDVSVRRCRSALVAVWFAAGLFLCELLFCVGWIYARSPEQRVPVWVWLATVVFFGFLVWYRRKKSTELAYLLSLREGAPGSTDPGWLRLGAARRVRRGKKTRFSL
jgi:hypothetical protein